MLMAVLMRPAGPGASGAVIAFFLVELQAALRSIAAKSARLMSPVM
jgi:hypothetical protein